MEMTTTFTFEQGRRPGIAPRPARAPSATRLSAAQREALRALIHEPHEASNWRERDGRDASLFGVLAIGLAALVGLTFGHAVDATFPQATVAAVHVSEAVTRAAAPIVDIGVVPPAAQASSAAVSRTM